MFALPQVGSFLPLTGIASGTLGWSAAGAMLTWILVVGLLGAVVGLLRESRRAADTRAAKPCSDAAVTYIRAGIDRLHAHRQAA